MLNDIRGNATDLPITEHVMDTHGVTLDKFALIDLLRLPGTLKFGHATASLLVRKLLGVRAAERSRRHAE